MSHSAHRLATKDELKRDYVILVRPSRGIDDADEATKKETLRKTKELADIANQEGPANIGRTGAGCTSQGYTYDQVLNKVEFNGFMSVFTDKEKVRRVLKGFKEKNVGLSVVTSGLTEDIFEICKDVGLKPHTILFSLGIWGKKELLPSEDYLKITTLCGHSMVSPSQIDHCVEKIKKGEMTLEEGGRRLAKPCPCGIYNVPRTIEVLKKMIEK